MRFEPNDELLSETMEIGERLLQWSKDQELPFHAYKQHIGGHRRAKRREGEEHRDTASTHSPYRRAQEDYARVTQKRQRARDEEYPKTAKRRESPRVKSRERERRSSPRPEKRPSLSVERRPSPRTWKTAEDVGNFRTSKPCTFCGRKHPSDCKFKGHPDANTDPSIPWSESRVGREMSKAGYGSSGLDYELRWDSARKELVPLGKAGTGRTATTDKHR